MRNDDAVMQKKHFFVLALLGLSACVSVPVPAPTAATASTVSVAASADAPVVDVVPPVPVVEAVSAPAPAPEAVEALTEEQARAAKVEAFIQEAVDKHGLDRVALQGLFDRTVINQDIIQRMTKPAESMPWSRYRPIFIIPERLQTGAEFWEANLDLINTVSAQYQVPPELVVAILGIETFYGKNTGNFPVFEANATLFLAYPKRSDFFRQQLMDFLLLSNSDMIDLLETRGSYAGAMGMAQFISSSYRNYAVDFDGDGRRDLWQSLPDIVASVANYFAQHRWRLGEPAAIPATLAEGAQPEAFISTDLQPPRFSLEALAAAGVTPAGGLDPAFDVQLPVNLLRLDGVEGDEYYITFHNFYVITRYNRSPLYAMAAVDMMSALQRPGVATPGVVEQKEGHHEAVDPNP